MAEARSFRYPIRHGCPLRNSRSDPPAVKATCCQLPVGKSTFSRTMVAGWCGQRYRDRPRCRADRNETGRPVRRFSSWRSMPTSVEPPKTHTATVAHWWPSDNWPRARNRTSRGRSAPSLRPAPHWNCSPETREHAVVGGPSLRQPAAVRFVELPVGDEIARAR